MSFQNHTIYQKPNISPDRNSIDSLNIENSGPEKNIRNIEIKHGYSPSVDFVAKSK